jgi:hypothetical protein
LHISAERPKDAENLDMDANASFYVGNAAIDQVRNTGWFLGQFVPAEAGLRHQTDVELKWGIHPDGEKRTHPWANGNATTVSILIRGSLRVAFHVGERPQMVTLEKQGDYIVFGPDVVHAWEAIGDTLVLSVRFPSVEVGKAADRRRDIGGS